jgi:hypothetical protein
MDPLGTVPAPDPGNIFVSYSRVDLPWVEALVKDLEAAGLKVWLDVRKLRPGTTWDSEIERALHETGALMVVLSPDSVKSRNVLDEISFALSKNRLVVPVLYRPCEVPYRLARLQHVDFTGNREAALARLLEYLKGAWDETGSSAPSDTSAVDGPARPPMVRADRGRWTMRRVGLLALPTALLGALAVGAAFWRVPTTVTLEVVTQRASFVVRGDEPQDLLNLSPQFSELRVEECGGMSFSAAAFAPETADAPEEPAPAGAGPVASGRVSFTCGAGGTITLSGTGDPGTLIGVLDHVRVVPETTVILDVASGGKEPVLTVDVSAGQTLHIPIHAELRIVTDLTDLTQPPLPADVRRSLRSGLAAYRARLSEANRFLDLQTGARTVLIVTPLLESARDFFRTDSPLPVDSLQFFGEMLGVDTPTPLRRGTLSYPGFPGIPPVEFSNQFLVLSSTADMFVRSLALEPEGLKLTLGGRILKGAIGSGGPGTSNGSRWRDPRLTALQTFYGGPVWKMAGVAALWLAATLAMMGLGAGGRRRASARTGH